MDSEKRNYKATTAWYEQQQCQRSKHWDYSKTDIERIFLRKTQEVLRINRDTLIRECTLLNPQRRASITMHLGCKY